MIDPGYLLTYVARLISEISLCVLENPEGCRRLKPQPQTQPAHETWPTQYINDQSSDLLPTKKPEQKR